ncbi:MAG: imidazole glycerol phosphate synthase subunit HisH [Lachnospiraceae bacterium]|nr:imidazole glycerol phosphate synthase subunit HisH [Lachnospiraceae bacterium]MCR5087288.1 imidazole glycerol phosphate synthase subunit HisH [Lachnospiraceae bacterium]
MIAIIDYDAGNIRSVENALNSLGIENVVTSDPAVIRAADRVILPGVGAFGDAMKKLEDRGLTEVIREAAAEKPFLGICLGLQLLFDSSEEAPGVKGLSVLPGEIVRIPEGGGRKIPHIGWNDLSFPKESELFRGVAEGSYVYFVHSYYLRAEHPEDVAATTEYGVTIHAAVSHGKVFACQFHPEKSGDVGMQILRNFAAV